MSAYAVRNTPRCSTITTMKHLLHVAAAIVAAIAAAVVLVACGSPSKGGVAAAGEDYQYSFASPEEAGLALANAAANLDGDELRRIFGPDIAVLSSGDAAQDDIDLQRFALAYDAAHSVRAVSDTQAALVVGERAWTFPVPIVRDGTRWYFDTAAGGNVVREARIAANEARAVLALVALAGAEAAYFDMDPDGDGVKAFATRIVSSGGATDGLFWTDDVKAVESPVGVELAVADATWSSPEPYDGYLFRVVPPTGTRGSSTVAIVAFPADVGETGRHTFVILDGAVWQRDLGASTRSTAMSLRDFAPDASWSRVEVR